MVEKITQKKLVRDKMLLEGKRIFIHPLVVDDVSLRYVNWLNDPEVNRFLSVRGMLQDMDTVREYVRSYDFVDNKLLLGIFEKTSNLHIGNITFSSIDWKNEVGVIGIAIGDKDYWGKGYATEALTLIVNFAFSRLKLHRLEAGISVNNLPSQKLFKKIGFKLEGILEEREKFGDEYVDVLIFGLLGG